MDTWGRVNLRPAPSLLHADLAKKMDAVTVLFEEWQQGTSYRLHDVLVYYVVST